MSEQHHEEEHHIVSPKIYLTILFVLLICTAATVGAAFIDMGVLNPIIALAIACTKAVLVVLFFMHVKYSPKLTKLTVGAGVFTFLVLIGMTLADYFTRAWGRW
ncbi:MAG TPA: cytochrome C oxidase subunit IV family protein [Terracidiphilus sp.]|jgi:cytochrome c oxidase subunit 4|nr:cytochrome C oxidase subunit IV family protein [Terracidiphilus sp.]